MAEQRRRLGESVVPSPTAGRNDACPCGSGRKFKHCCLQSRTAEASARLRLRTAEGRVVDGLLQFTTETWGEPLIAHAWEDFWNYADVPEDPGLDPRVRSHVCPVARVGVRAGR